MSDNILVKAGRLVCFSRGEYSDYRYDGHFVALADITREAIAEVVEECRDAARKKNAEDAFDGDDFGADGFFLPALIRRGLILDVTCQEIHTGSYGRLDV